MRLKPGRNSLLLLLGISILSFVGCLGKRECQSPPPSFYFQVQKNDTIYPIQGDSSGRLNVFYMAGSQRINVSDLAEINGAYSSSEIIERSWTLKNPDFVIELDGEVLTSIAFETYINNDKCQGWPSISNVYEHGQRLQKEDYAFYILGRK
jgi:hypothetical protein